MGSGLIFVGKRAKTKMPYLQKPRFYAASRLCHYYTVWAKRCNKKDAPLKNLDFIKVFRAFRDKKSTSNSVDASKRQIDSNLRDDSHIC
jgi:hypothetical protein